MFETMCSTEICQKREWTGQEVGQRNDYQTKNKIPKMEGAGVEGKHIAKRDVSQWIYYGDPKDWDLEFESAVLDAVEKIKSGTLKASGLVKHFENVRSAIAQKRGNPKSRLFGLRRNDYTRPNSSCSCLFTRINHQSKAFGYALERAVIIPYDGKYFVEVRSDGGKFWEKKFYYRSGATGELDYGLVQGYIDGAPIPLTQYVFCPRTEYHRKSEVEDWFGSSDDDYFGDNKESAIWLHTAGEQIPHVLSHIDKLIDKALTGDLSVIPRIHWWYVHLTPTWRGSAGIAEMLTNTLCRLYDVDLPPWKDGVAPSVEVLLEPNETRFCSSYHLLFAQEQEKLQTLFESTDEMPDQDSAKSCSSTPPQKKVEKTGEFNIKKSERIAAKKK